MRRQSIAQAEHAFWKFDRLLNAHRKPRKDAEDSELENDDPPIAKSMNKRLRTAKKDNWELEDDSDLFAGRFKPSKPASKSGSGCGGPVASLPSSTTTAEEDTLRNLLLPELTQFFASGSDSVLFLKAIVADGLVPWLRCRVCVCLC